GHAAGREAFAITQPVNEIDNRDREVARQDEVAVERVAVARVIDGAPCGDQALREHLAAEHAAGTDVTVPAAVDVALDPLDVEQADEVAGGVRHSAQAAV